MPKQYKYLTSITVFFVTVLLVSNIASSKILVVGPFTFDGGTILFPLSYIFGDIITEVYGYSHSRKIIWYGIYMLLLTAVILMIVGKLPPAPDWGGQSAYDQILGLTPRIVAASITAFFAGEFVNAFILAKMKILTKGKYLWTRTIGSTVVGEGVDSLLFVFLAFFGAVGFSTDLLVLVFVSNYIFKVAIEIFFTPVTYAAVGFLKKKEHEDYYDNDTNFNPFVQKLED